MVATTVTSSGPLAGGDQEEREDGPAVHRRLEGGERTVTGRVKPTGLALALQLAVFAGGLAAQSPVDSFFPPRPTGYLTDAAGVVDAGSAAIIDSIALRLKTATGAELAVVTLPTIGDYAAADVALAIGRAWGVGAAAEIGDARRNAGIVLLLVPRREGDPNSGHVFISHGAGSRGDRHRRCRWPGARRDAPRAAERAVRAGAGDRHQAARGAGGARPRGDRQFADGRLRPSGDLSPGFLIFLLIIVVVIVVTLARASGGGSVVGRPSPSGAADILGRWRGGLGRRRLRRRVWWRRWGLRWIRRWRRL